MFILVSFFSLISLNPEYDVEFFLKKNHFMLVLNLNLLSQNDFENFF